MKILRQPTDFEPAYQPSLLFELDAEGNEDRLEFRYGFEVEVSKTNPDVFFSVFEGFTFPLDNGRALYSPHRVLQSELGFNFQPFCLSIQNAGESLINYRLNVKERWNPDLYFTDITESFGSELVVNGSFNNFLNGWTATRMIWQPYSSLGEVPARAQYEAPSNGPYDGKIEQTISVDPGTDYYVEVDYRVYGITQPVKIRVQVVYSDNSGKYEDTGYFGRPTTSTIGLSFNSREETSILLQVLVLTLQGATLGAQIFRVSMRESSNLAILEFDSDPGLQAGDIIRINKTDKTINPQYDRFVEVISADSDSANVNLVIGERSSVPQTGRIISIIRQTEQSDVKKAFNGARQVIEKDVDFSIYRIPLSLGDEVFPPAKWLHPVTSRRIADYTYNTLSFAVSDELLAISGGSDISSPSYPASWGALITSYDSVDEVLNEFYVDSSTSFRTQLNRFDIGSGTANWSWIQDVEVIPGNTKRYKTEIVSRTDYSNGFHITLILSSSNQNANSEFHVDDNTFSIVDVDYAPTPYQTFTANILRFIDSIEELAEAPGYPYTLTIQNDTPQAGYYTITWTSDSPFTFNIMYDDYHFGDSGQLIYFGDKPYDENDAINGGWNNSAYPALAIVESEYEVLTEPFWHYIEEDCGGSCCQKVQLCWLNKLGGIDYFTFDLISSKTISISRDTMEKTIPLDWSIGDRGTKDYNIDSRERWNLEANFLSDEEANLIKDAVESREVYMLKYPITVPGSSDPEDFKGYLIPINIVNESFTIQEIEYRDSIDYQITIEFSNNTQNN